MSTEDTKLQRTNVFLAALTATVVAWSVAASVSAQPVPAERALLLACAEANTFAELEAAAARSGAEPAADLVGRAPGGGLLVAVMPEADERRPSAPIASPRIVRAWRTAGGTLTLIYVEFPLPEGVRFGLRQTGMARYCQVNGRVADSGSATAAVMATFRMPHVVVLAPGHRSFRTYGAEFREGADAPLTSARLDVTYGESLNRALGLPAGSTQYMPVRQEERLLSNVAGQPAEVELLNDNFTEVH